MCVLHARKKEETQIGIPLKPIDVEGVKLLEPLVRRGNEQIWDVIAWLKEERQKGGAEGK